MTQVLSLFTFGIGALFFLAFFTTLKPTFVSAASWSEGPASAARKLRLRSPALPDICYSSVA
jgi:hypothetical protein